MRLASDTRTTSQITRLIDANADAMESGAEAVEGTVDGTRWTQDPFKYQGKCLQWLREAYAALAPGDRAAVDAALTGSGCEILFSD